MTDRKPYDTGWDDCIAYIQDKRKLQDKQVGWGAVLLLLGTITFLVPIGVLILATIANVAVNVFSCVVISSVAIILLIAGYLVDKKDKVRYKEIEKAHYKKWADRWTSLGFSGDE